MKPDLHVNDDVETPFLASGPSVDSSQSQPGHARKKPLTLLPLIAIIFFEVSGGPFGTEVCIAKCQTAEAADAACHVDAALI
jgi:hypothetical protein